MRRLQLGKFATAAALAAMLYPVAAVALAQFHYKMTSRDLSEGIVALLLLTAFPMFLLSLFTLVIAIRSEGNQRKISVVCSVLGGILNVLFFVTGSSGY